MLKIDVIQVDEIASYRRDQVSAIRHGRNVRGSHSHVSQEIPGHLY
jgi:hypothetical protein